MAERKYWQAINDALFEEIERDPLVCLLGQDVGRAGGPFGSTRGLFDRFGERRVWDTPISELGLMALGSGGALAGIRPIVDVMYMDFMLLAMDQLVNQAAKMRFMSGGRYTVPLTVLTMVAAGTRSGPQHSQSFESWLGQVPGLRVAWPATPADAKGLIKTAIRTDDPVVIIQSLSLWRAKGEIPEGDVLVPLGRARVARRGKDLTVVAAGATVSTALEAAEQVAVEGIEAEVIDIRSISPLDQGAVLESVGRTGRLVVVQEGPEPFGWGRHVISGVTLEDPGLFDCAPRVAAPPFSPTPFSPELEDAFLPSADRIASTMRSMLEAQT